MNKAEKAKNRTDAALEDLAAALAAGKSDSLARYLRTMATFHDYSFGNCVLIAQQCPEATRVAGFRAWTKLGRHVRKGEKGIVIIAPIVRKNDDNERAVAGFRAAHVFDVSQTDGEPLPEPAAVSGDPAGHIDELMAFIRDKGIRLDYAEDLGGADGRSYGGRIEIRSGLARAEEFSVLAHELAHELLHKNSDAPRLPKTVRETEAEAVAFVVSHAVGLETGTAASDYIQLYQGDCDTLAASLQRIQSAASHIIQALA